jgi:two-component system sensor histidine kinase HydH
VNKEVAALYRINQFLAHLDNLDDLLQSIMQEASRAAEAQASSIALYDSQTKDLCFTVSIGKKASQIKQMRLKLGQGIIGYAASSRKPVNIPDVSKDKRFHSDADKKTKFKTKSILAVPILYQKRLIGALEVLNKKGKQSFSKEDTRLLEIVAGQAAIAIENAKLYQRIIQKHAALKDKHNRLVEMQKKMLMMERMSAIGDMASRMVHDLRNPLTVVRGCAELIQYSSPEGSDGRKYSKIVVDEVDRLAGMAAEVMDFVKGKTTVLFQNHNFSEFMQAVSDFLERDFQPHNIKLIMESNYKGSVYMDKSKMQRTIFNISFNARDAMNGGGRFKIESNLVDNNLLEVKLSDTGPGIPPEIKDKLCQPFATFGKSHGTGLGLAIVKKTIETHKGTLTIESRPPKEGEFSTTFTIRIPIKPPEAVAQLQQAA